MTRQGRRCGWHWQASCNRRKVCPDYVENLIRLLFCHLWKTFPVDYLRWEYAHRIKQTPGAKPPRPLLHVLQVRVEQGQKLRALYRSLGWSRRDAAKFLHTSERTLHNWEAGRHPVPPMALRLLRMHCGMELPGAAWRGWSISRGKLCTPEGHELEPKDAAWWALLVRRAEVGMSALAALAALKRQHHLPQESRPSQREGPREAGIRAGAGGGLSIVKQVGLEDQQAVNLPSI